MFNAAEKDFDILGSSSDEGIRKLLYKEYCAIIPAYHAKFLDDNVLVDGNSKEEEDKFVERHLKDVMKAFPHLSEIAATMITRKTFRDMPKTATSYFKQSEEETSKVSTTTMCDSSGDADASGISFSEDQEIKRPALTPMCRNTETAVECDQTEKGKLLEQFTLASKPSSELVEESGNSSTKLYALQGIYNKGADLDHDNAKDMCKSIICEPDQEPEGYISELYCPRESYQKQTDAERGSDKDLRDDKVCEASKELRNSEAQITDISEGAQGKPVYGSRSVVPLHQVNEGVVDNSPVEDCATESANTVEGAHGPSTEGTGGVVHLHQINEGNVDKESELEDSENQLKKAQGKPIDGTESVFKLHQIREGDVDEKLERKDFQMQLANTSEGTGGKQVDGTSLVPIRFSDERSGGEKTWVVDSKTQFTNILEGSQPKSAEVVHLRQTKERNADENSEPEDSVTQVTNVSEGVQGKQRVVHLNQIKQENVGEKPEVEDSANEMTNIFKDFQAEPVDGAGSGLYLHRVNEGNVDEKPEVGDSKSQLNNILGDAQAKPAGETEGMAHLGQIRKTNIDEKLELEDSKTQLTKIGIVVHLHEICEGNVEGKSKKDDSDTQLSNTSEGVQEKQVKVTGNVVYLHQFNEGSVNDENSELEDCKTELRNTLEGFQGRPSDRTDSIVHLHQINEESVGDEKSEVDASQTQLTKALESGQGKQIETVNVVHLRQINGGTIDAKSEVDDSTTQVTNILGCAQGKPSDDTESAVHFHQIKEGNTGEKLEPDDVSPTCEISENEEEEECSSCDDCCPTEPHESIDQKGLVTGRKRSCKWRHRFRKDMRRCQKKSTKTLKKSVTRPLLETDVELSADFSAHLLEHQNRGDDFYREISTCQPKVYFRTGESTKRVVEYERVGPALRTASDESPFRDYHSVTGTKLGLVESNVPWDVKNIVRQTQHATAEDGTQCYGTQMTHNENQVNFYGVNECGGCINLCPSAEEHQHFTHCRQNCLDPFKASCFVESSKCLQPPRNLPEDIFSEGKREDLDFKCTHHLTAAENRLPDGLSRQDDNGLLEHVRPPTPLPTFVRDYDFMEGSDAPMMSAYYDLTLEGDETSPVQNLHREKYTHNSPYGSEVFLLPHENDRESLESSISELDVFSQDERRRACSLKQTKYSNESMEGDTALCLKVHMTTFECASQNESSLTEGCESEELLSHQSNLKDRDDYRIIGKIDAILLDSDSESSDKKECVVYEEAQILSRRSEVADVKEQDGIDGEADISHQSCLLEELSRNDARENESTCGSDGYVLTRKTGRTDLRDLDDEVIDAEISQVMIKTSLTDHHPHEMLETSWLTEEEEEEKRGKAGGNCSGRSTSFPSFINLSYVSNISSVSDDEDDDTAPEKAVKHSEDTPHPFPDSRLLKDGGCRDKSAGNDSVDDEIANRKTVTHFNVELKCCDNQVKQHVKEKTNFENFQLFIVPRLKELVEENLHEKEEEEPGGGSDVSKCGIKIVVDPARQHAEPEHCTTRSEENSSEIGKLVDSCGPQKASSAVSYEVEAHGETTEKDNQKSAKSEESNATGDRESPKPRENLRLLRILEASWPKLSDEEIENILTKTKNSPSTDETGRCDLKCTVEEKKYFTCDSDESSLLHSETVFPQKSDLTCGKGCASSSTEEEVSLDKFACSSGSQYGSCARLQDLGKAVTPLSLRSLATFCTSGEGRSQVADGNSEFSAASTNTDNQDFQQVQSDRDEVISTEVCRHNSQLPSELRAMKSASNDNSTGYPCVLSCPGSDVDLSHAEEPKENIQDSSREVPQRNFLLEVYLKQSRSWTFSNSSSGTGQDEQESPYCRNFQNETTRVFLPLSPILSSEEGLPSAENSSRHSSDTLGEDYALNPVSISNFEGDRWELIQVSPDSSNSGSVAREKRHAGIDREAGLPLASLTDGRDMDYKSSPEFPVESKRSQSERDHKSGSDVETTLAFQISETTTASQMLCTHGSDKSSDAPLRKECASVTDDTMYVQLRGESRNLDDHEAYVVEESADVPERGKDEKILSDDASSGEANKLTDASCLNKPITSLNAVLNNEIMNSRPNNSTPGSAAACVESHAEVKSSFVCPKSGSVHSALSSGTPGEDAEECLRLVVLHTSNEKRHCCSSKVNAVRRLSIMAATAAARATQLPDEPECEQQVNAVPTFQCLKSSGEEVDVRKTEKYDSSSDVSVSRNTVSDREVATDGKERNAVEKSSLELLADIDYECSTPQIKTGQCEDFECEISRESGMEAENTNEMSDMITCLSERQSSDFAVSTLLCSHDTHKDPDGIKKSNDETKDGDCLLTRKKENFDENFEVICHSRPSASSRERNEDEENSPKAQIPLTNECVKSAIKNCESSRTFESGGNETRVEKFGDNEVVLNEAEQVALQNAATSFAGGDSKCKNFEKESAMTPEKETDEENHTAQIQQESIPFTEDLPTVQFQEDTDISRNVTCLNRTITSLNAILNNEVMNSHPSNSTPGSAACAESHDEVLSSTYLDQADEYSEFKSLTFEQSTNYMALLEAISDSGSIKHLSGMSAQRYPSMDALNASDTKDLTHSRRESKDVTREVGSRLQKDVPVSKNEKCLNNKPSECLLEFDLEAEVTEKKENLSCEFGMHEGVSECRELTPPRPYNQRSRKFRDYEYHTDGQPERNSRDKPFSWKSYRSRRIAQRYEQEARREHFDPENGATVSCERTQRCYVRSEELYESSYRKTNQRRGQSRKSQNYGRIETTQHVTNTRFTNVDRDNYCAEYGGFSSHRNQQSNYGRGGREYRRNNCKGDSKRYSNGSECLDYPEACQREQSVNPQKRPTGSAQPSKRQTQAQPVSRSRSRESETLPREVKGNGKPRYYYRRNEARENPDVHAEKERCEQKAKKSSEKEDNGHESNTNGNKTKSGKKKKHRRCQSKKRNHEKPTESQESLSETKAEAKTQNCSSCPLETQHREPNPCGTDLKEFSKDNSKASDAKETISMNRETSRKMTKSNDYNGKISKSSNGKMSTKDCSDGKVLKNSDSIGKMLKDGDTNGKLLDVSFANERMKQPENDVHSELQTQSDTCLRSRSQNECFEDKLASATPCNSFGKASAFENISGDGVDTSEFARFADDDEQHISSGEVEPPKHPEFESGTERTEQSWKPNSAYENRKQYSQVWSNPRDNWASTFGWMNYMKMNYPPVWDWRAKTAYSSRYRSCMYYPPPTAREHQNFGNMYLWKAYEEMRYQNIFPGATQCSFQANEQTRRIGRRFDSNYQQNNRSFAGSKTSNAWNNSRYSRSAGIRSSDCQNWRDRRSSTGRSAADSGKSFRNQSSFQQNTRRNHQSSQEQYCRGDDASSTVQDIPTSEGRRGHGRTQAMEECFSKHNINELRNESQCKDEEESYCVPNDRRNGCKEFQRSSCLRDQSTQPLTELQQDVNVNDNNDDSQAKTGTETMEMLFWETPGTEAPQLKDCCVATDRNPSVVGYSSCKAFVEDEGDKTAGNYDMVAREENETPKTETLSSVLGYDETNTFALEEDETFLRGPVNEAQWKKQFVWKASDMETPFNNASSSCSNNSNFENLEQIGQSEKTYLYVPQSEYMKPFAPCFSNEAYDTYVDSGEKENFAMELPMSDFYTNSGSLHGLQRNSEYFIPQASSESVYDKYSLNLSTQKMIINITESDSETEDNSAPVTNANSFDSEVDSADSRALGEILKTSPCPDREAIRFGSVETPNEHMTAKTDALKETDLANNSSNILKECISPQLEQQVSFRGCLSYCESNEETAKEETRNELSENTFFPMGNAPHDFGYCGKPRSSEDAEEKAKKDGKEDHFSAKKQSSPPFTDDDTTRKLSNGYSPLPFALNAADSQRADCSDEGINRSQSDQCFVKPPDPCHVSKRSSRDSNLVPISMMEGIVVQRMNVHPSPASLSENIRKDHENKSDSLSENGVKEQRTNHSAASLGESSKAENKNSILSGSPVASTSIAEGETNCRGDSNAVKQSPPGQFYHYYYGNIATACDNDLKDAVSDEQVQNNVKNDKEEGKRNLSSSAPHNIDDTDILDYDGSQILSSNLFVNKQERHKSSCSFSKNSGNAVAIGDGPCLMNASSKVHGNSNDSVSGILNSDEKTRDSSCGKNGEVEEQGSDVFTGDTVATKNDQEVYINSNLSVGSEEKIENLKNSVREESCSLQENNDSKFVDSNSIITSLSVDTSEGRVPGGSNRPSFPVKGDGSNFLTSDITISFSVDTTTSEDKVPGELNPPGSSVRSDDAKFLISNTTTSLSADTTASASGTLGEIRNPSSSVRGGKSEQSCSSGVMNIAGNLETEVSSSSQAESARDELKSCVDSGAFRARDLQGKEEYNDSSVMEISPSCSSYETNIAVFSKDSVGLNHSIENCKVPVNKTVNSFSPGNSSRHQPADDHAFFHSEDTGVCIHWKRNRLDCLYEDDESNSLPEYGREANRGRIIGTEEERCEPMKFTCFPKDSKNNGSKARANILVSASETDERSSKSVAEKELFLHLADPTSCLNDREPKECLPEVDFTCASRPQDAHSRSSDGGGEDDSSEHTTALVKSSETCDDVTRQAPSEEGKLHSEARLDVDMGGSSPKLSTGLLGERMTDAEDF